MVKTKGPESLSIRVVVAGENFDFVLREGESLLVGRDSTCQVTIEDDSISSRHLEIRWHSGRVEVSDLESSNGTFRMPQDAPFLEAKLDVTQNDLELRLAKIPLSLEWKKVHPYLGPSKIEDGPASSSEGKAGGQSEGNSETEKQSPSIDREQRREEGAGTEKIRGLLTLFGPLIIGAVVLLAYSLTHLSVLQSLMQGSAFSDLNGGLGLDALIVLSENFIWVAVGITVALYLQKKIFSGQSSERKYLKALSFALALSPVLILLLVALATKKPLGAYSDFRTFRVIQQRAQAHDFSSKTRNLEFSQMLSSVDERFVGSSAFYAVLYNFQKERAVQECEGTGEGAWKQKRFCLILLYALAVESFSVVRPRHYLESSATLVLLSSLDGIARVLAAEGPQSEYVEVFLKSLDRVGLSRELATFQQFVNSFENRSFAELMESLLVLRRNLEARLIALQREDALPERFDLDLRGPLEMGI